MKEITFEQVRDKVSTEFSMATPFRIGALAGKLGVTVSHPYKPGSRGEKSFNDGVEWGKRCRTGEGPDTTGEEQQ